MIRWPRPKKLAVVNRKRLRDWRNLPPAPIGHRFQLWVPGSLPSYNEVVAGARQQRGGGASGYSIVKKRATMGVAGRAVACPYVFRRAEVICEWLAADKRTDPDNLISAVKFILDGLVEAGTLPDDGWDEIESLRQTWRLSAKEAGVQVTLISC